MTIGYSIDLLFDKEFESYVKGLWKGCAKKGFACRLSSVEGDVMPHIAISLYENIEDDEIIPLFERYKNIDEKKAEFLSSAVCLFKNTYVTYINVNVNRSMLDYFENAYHFFSALSDKSSPYYVPYSIIPHVSISRCDSLKKAKKCWNYVADVFQPQKFTVGKIGLFKLWFDDAHVLKRCVLVDEKVLME